MFTGILGKEMMINQGYVPATCTLDPEIAGPLIYSEIMKGKSPCDDCNGDRLICKGKIKKKEKIKRRN